MLRYGGPRRNIVISFGIEKPEWWKKFEGIYTTLFAKWQQYKNNKQLN